MILETLVRQAIADPLHSPLALPAAPGAAIAPLGQAPQGATLPPHAFLSTGASATPVVGTPAAARGMVLSATPAPGENGLTGQILTIAPISFVAIRRGAGGPVIGYLHATRTSQTGGVPRVFTYGPGSLWLTATMFSPQAPANGFMGVAFQSLELSIPGAIISVPLGNDILIDPAATLGVSLVPASPGGASGFSNDGTATTVILPATIGFALPPVGVATVQLGDAHVTTCGTTLALGGGSIATNWDAPPGEMVFTYRSTTPATFAASGSTLRGSASVLIGQYRLAVAETTPTALAAAASGGVPCILLSRGLVATWRDGRTLGLDTTLLLAQQGNLGVRAAIRQRGFTDGYTLWTAPGPPPKPTRFTFIIPAGAALVLSLSAAVEAAWVLGASLQAALDRPITVAGALPKFSQLVFYYGVERTQSGTSLTVFGLPRPPPAVIAVPPPPVEVFAIENALLRTAGIVWLWGLMSLNGTQANAGLLIAGQVLTDLMPTLPDPYASSADPLARQSVPAGLLTEIGWASETLVELGFTLLPPLANPASIGAPPVLLLDVSGRADQLGVFIPQRRQSGDIGQITGQTWELLGDQLAVFTLPHISWEAVIADTVRDTTTGEIVAAPRTWFTPFAADDGAPVSLTTLGKTLRPVEPLAALAALRSDYAGGADLTANFTLPFGLNATVDSGALVDGPITLLKPGMEAVDASFPGLQAGAQLRLTARFNLFQLGPHSMPGRASAPDGYAQALLDPAIATIWNQQFNDAAIPGRPPPDPPTRAVPVTRIDLSGYGASMVSDWVNPTDGTAIDQARFHVFVGRTSYELVEAQTYILPWNIPAVDATVFERDAAGYIARHNTGWRARDVPALRYGNPPPVLVEAGAVRDVRNVRNIRPSGGADIVVPSWGSYRPVLFDADVLLLTDTGPGSHGLAVTDPPNGVLASRGLVGYLRLTVAGPPTLDEASAVLQRVDALNAARAAGPIAADVLIASTGFGFSLTAIDVRAIQPVGSPQANIAVALRGTPHLPRDGAWSVTRRRATDPAPVPVDPLLPVPLVRLNAVPATWHIMEPDDLGFLAAGQDPPTTYGLLQSTGTQKMLLEHPTLVDGDPVPLRTKKTPALADVGSLLGIPGLLPDIGSLLQLPSLQGLTPKADGLQTAVVTQLLTIPPTVLLALGPIKVILGTATAKILGVPASPAPQSLVTLTLDPTAPPGKRWAITIDKASFMLTFDGFGAPDALVAVTGTLSAREGEGPGLSDIHVYYGDALALVTAVLQGIEAVAQFLPGGSKPPFSVDFSGSTLKIHESFGLPMLPLGFGFLQDIALEMGFEVDVLARKLRFSVGVGSEQDPFTWLVSPLAGNGLIALGATDQLGVEMQAGIGAGLGIDLAIASGSATVTLAVRIDTTQNPFILMVVLSGTAEVDVLDGLASASITLSAGLGVGVKVPLPPPLDPIEAAKETEVTLEAEIAVGIHISVCWVVHVDWTGSWPFRETVTGASLTGLLP